MSNTTNATNTTNIPIKKQYDIHDRIYWFIVDVIKLINMLPKTLSNDVITKQILRSVTSMGANDQEADGTITKKDFIHCFTIVRKEGKETNFWLNLTADTNPQSIKEKTAPIIREGKEIVAIISSIINKTRAKNN
ncbi:MAG TPA: four helix bundle protein [Candidatus Saccharimonadales bacterium]|nr:four helix bundle protein [Candidatus Saccharimonadales bacterium]